MKNNRDLSKLNFEINNHVDLNKMLTGVLIGLRRGDENDLQRVKMMTLVADKINKNNVNAIENKKVSKHKRPIQFFEDNTEAKQDTQDA